MDLKLLEECLGYQFKNRNLIIEALTHKSFRTGYNNERLEYLGDAVLNLIVAEYLFKRFPQANEGELSKIRASLVNEKGFSLLANELDLGRYLLISSAEQNNKGRSKPSLLSNAFEALMGAIYLESSLNVVANIIYRLLEKVYPIIDLRSLYQDYKTALQEYTQAEFGSTPEYELLEAIGPDHKKEFHVAVIINNECYAKGWGKSKKEAQQVAAKEALGRFLGPCDVKGETL